MRTSITLLMLIAFLFAACHTATDKTKAVEHTEIQDPLPSWNEGPTKKAIITFVNSVVNKGGAGYVRPEERIATFDNDGTLWCEQPVAQFQFLVYQIKKMAADHPEWKQTQPYKSILEDDTDYLMKDLMRNQGKEVSKLFATTHANMTLEQFDSNVATFLTDSQHPKFGKKYTETVYQPMLELLHYLRNNQFKTYICSGGGNDFMRVFANDIYGVVPENVIGSFAMNSFEQLDGEWEIVKGTAHYFMNDNDNKPAAIQQRIGRIPIFASGNVRSGGDIGQLTYSQTNTLPNFQLLINHDDAVREFAYAEEDNASLQAAQEGDWHVVSMKKDWSVIFPFQKNQ